MNILGNLNKIKKEIEAFVYYKVKQRRIKHYLKSERRPWGPGYSEYRNQYLSEVLNNKDLLETFLHNRGLPSGYGFRLDARMVEIPWVMARVTAKNGRILDAGSSLNHSVILQAPALADKKVTIVTLAPEPRCFWSLGISYVYNDLRNLDFKDDTFDVVACISTIEHIGMDNRRYCQTDTCPEGRAPDSFEPAVLEIRRVLKPGGVLYVTMPFGRYEDHIWFQQFDSKLLDRLIQVFRPGQIQETVYRYEPDGWKLGDRDTCSQCSFFDVHQTKYFDAASTIDFPEDYPAGERAVACLEMVNKQK